jgi:phage portal protein BeeE
MYAETPQPVTVLTNNGPRKTPEQVNELVAAWETARRTRSTAYLGRDVAADSIGFDATQIALADARSYGVLDVARVTGVPSLYLSQGPADASMTYINATQARLDLQAAMQPFTTAIAERLSFDDVTGQGVTVEFDYAAWLTVDPKYRADLWATLIPAGVLSADEARAIEPLVAEIGVPR